MTSRDLERLSLPERLFVGAVHASWKAHLAAPLAWPGGHLELARGVWFMRFAEWLRGRPPP